MANETKKEMAKTIDGVNNKRILNKTGAFASLYDFKFDGIEEPLLVLKTEEPGSKQLIAAQYDKIENVCYDMINHLINDCIVMGAKPLTVQDAIICGKMDKDIVTRIVKTISKACEEQGCSLTGGETSEQPGVLEAGTYILTSSIVGVVDKRGVIDGSAIEDGDVVLALESSGVHTNGYTLIRSIMEKSPQIMEERFGKHEFIEEILIPHRCYYKTLEPLFGKGIIHGLAHITGGGICENLNRILPDGMDAQIYLDKYEILPIFKVLKKYGNVDDPEMLRTFNLGVGMVLVTGREQGDNIIKYIEKGGIKCYEIGQIVQGEKNVKCEGKLNWK